MPSNTNHILSHPSREGLIDLIAINLIIKRLKKTL
jgi:hypothetical protein